MTGVFMRRPCDHLLWWSLETNILTIRDCFKICLKLVSGHFQQSPQKKLLFVLLSAKVELSYVIADKPVRFATCVFLCQHTQGRGQRNNCGPTTLTDFYHTHKASCLRSPYVICIINYTETFLSTIDCEIIMCSWHTMYQCIHQHSHTKKC